MAEDTPLLKTLLAAPESPRNAQGNWQEVETQMSFRFPDDYKLFISEYGTGCISLLIQVLNVFEDSDRAEIMEVLASLRSLVENCYNDDLRLAARRGEDASSVARPFPYPIFPEPEGVFPWGVGQDGWRLFWNCQGASENWSIVVTYNGLEEVIDFPRPSMSEFLIDLLQSRGPESLYLSPYFDVTETT